MAWFMLLKPRKSPMSNPTTKPRKLDLKATEQRLLKIIKAGEEARAIQTWEQRFDDMWMEKQHPGNGSAVDADELKSFIREELKAERSKVIDDVRNLLDEFNDIPDDALGFELRVRRPVELMSRLEKLKALEESTL